MDLNILNRISQIQDNKELRILYLAYEDNEQILTEFNNYSFIFDILCPSLFVRGFLRRYVSRSKNINLLIQQDLNNSGYDVIITPLLTYNNLGLLFNKYHFKYVITLNNENLIPTGYQQLSENVFKLIENSNTPKEEKVEQKKQQLSQEQKDKIVQQNQLFKEFTEEYEVKPVKYGKYGINYLYDVVPGKISIIMIVSQRNNAFADLIRELKAQNVESVEYIIVDNAAGFRNNVKPNIRYGDKMPIDFCEYHAKQISSGEYIIVLNENSKSFRIDDYIAKGKYQTR